VECQWQALLISRPHLKYMELDWDKSFHPDQLQAVAEFIGMDVAMRNPTATETRKNVHVGHKRAQRDEAALAAELAAYRALLDLPPTTSIYQSIPTMKKPTM
jgi:hypothetical protein